MIQRPNFAIFPLAWLAEDICGAWGQGIWSKTDVVFLH
jgi:hypothetical protein